jgi:HAD superfamily phosphatase (TIGR01681 family)
MTVTENIRKKLKLQEIDITDVGTNTDKQLKDYKIFVFDLDNTLFLHKVKDEYRSRYHRKVKNFLNYLRDSGKKLYIATHNFDPNFLLYGIDVPPSWFNGIIRETKDVNPRVNYIEDYTSKKDMIFEILKNHKNLTVDDVIFFDDHPYNIKQVESIDVKSIYVDELKGIDFSEIY